MQNTVLAFLHLVTFRGNNYGNAYASAKQIACPNDVQQTWFYWDNEWKEGGENITFNCVTTTPNPSTCMTPTTPNTCSTSGSQGN